MKIKRQRWLYIALLVSLFPIFVSGQNYIIKDDIVLELPKDKGGVNKLEAPGSGSGSDSVGSCQTIPNKSPEFIQENAWIAKLPSTPDGGCAGALVSDIHVLTSSDCIDVYLNRGGLEVSFLNTENPSKIKATRVILDSFDSRRYSRDLAIIELSESVGYETPDLDLTSYPCLQGSPDNLNGAAYHENNQLEEVALERGDYCQNVPEDNFFRLFLTPNYVYETNIYSWGSPMFYQSENKKRLLGILRLACPNCCFEGRLGVPLYLPLANFREFLSTHIVMDESGQIVKPAKSLNLQDWHELPSREDTTELGSTPANSGVTTSGTTWSTLFLLVVTAALGHMVH